MKNSQYWFEIILNAISHDKIVFTDGSMSSFKDAKHLKSRIAVANLMTGANKFVFTESITNNEMDNKPWLDSYDESMPIDLPFEDNWLEVMGDNKAFFGTLNPLKAQNEEMSCYGILICQNPDNVLLDLVFQFFLPQGDLCDHIICLLSGDQNFRSIVKYLIDHLNSSFTSTISSRRMIKTKIGRHKIKHRIKNIVYVNKRRQKNVVSLEGKPIEWSHKWEVRGHWRVCKTIGKDRFGDYRVNGFTWVKPHEKGDGDLVKKTRLLR